EVVELLVGAAAPEQVRAEPFRHDDDAGGGIVAQLTGELEQEPGVVLDAERARIQQHLPADEVVAASPGVVARPARKLLDRRPVLDDEHAVVGDARRAREGPEVVRDADDGAARTELAPLEGDEEAPDEAADEGKPARKSALHRDAVDVLLPEHEPHAA